MPLFRFVLYIRQDESGVLYCTNNGFYKTDPDKIAGAVLAIGRYPVSASRLLSAFNKAGRLLVRHRKRLAAGRAQTLLPGGGMEPVWDEQDSKVFDRWQSNGLFMPFTKTARANYWMPTDMGVVRLDKKRKPSKRILSPWRRTQRVQPVLIFDKKGYL